MVLLPDGVGPSGWERMSEALRRETERTLTILAQHAMTACGTGDMERIYRNVALVELAAFANVASGAGAHVMLDLPGLDAHVLATALRYVLALGNARTLGMPLET